MFLLLVLEDDENRMTKMIFILVGVSETGHGLREGLRKKKVAVLLDFVQMRRWGRGRALAKFLSLFISAFLVNKRSLFPPKWKYFVL